MKLASGEAGEEGLPKNTPPPLEGGGWGEGLVGSQAPSMLANARAMRRDATPAEHRLWQRLRRHQLSGLKFPRQLPIGPFIADFYCASACLVIEVDGISHIDLRTDDARDKWMQDQGIRVFRVSNVEVLNNLEGVLLAIKEIALSTPPPCPLPQGEGEDSFASGFLSHAAHV